MIELFPPQWENEEAKQLSRCLLNLKSKYQKFFERNPLISIILEEFIMKRKYLDKGKKLLDSKKNPFNYICVL